MASGVAECAEVDALGASYLNGCHFMASPETGIRCQTWAKYPRLFSRTCLVRTSSLTNGSGIALAIWASTERGVADIKMAKAQGPG
jgi:hypothetical protein